MNVTFNDANRFYACLEDGSSCRWSRITLHENLIHLHVLQTTPPPSGALVLKVKSNLFFKTRLEKAECVTALSLHLIMSTHLYQSI